MLPHRIGSAAAVDMRQMRRPAWIADPRLHRALPWLCGLVATALAAKNLIGGYGDLGIYLDTGREFATGGIDLYRDRPNAGPWAYPHFAALPFALLHLVASDAAARWIWCLLLGLGTTILLRAVAASLRPFGGLSWWQWLAFGVLFQRCLAQNMTHGQLSLWVGTFVALGIQHLVEGRDRRAGIDLGVAAALKLTPLLFLLALPFQHRPRAGLWMAGTIATAVLLLPWPFCGTSEHWRHLGDFWRTITGALVAGGGSTIVEAYAGPSIAGTLDYLLQARPTDTAGHTVNLLDLTDGTLRLVRIGWSLLLAALLGLWFLRARSFPAAQRLALQCGAVALAIVFYAPLVRVYHLAAAMLPFALFCRGPHGRRDWLWWLTALLVLFSMTLRQRKLLGETLWRAFDAGGLLHFALVAMLVWFVRDAKRAPAGGPG